MPAFNYEKSFNGSRPNSHQGTVYNSYNAEEAKLELENLLAFEQTIKENASYSCVFNLSGEGKCRCSLVEMTRVLVFTDYRKRPAEYTWGTGSDWDINLLPKWAEHQMIFKKRP